MELPKIGLGTFSLQGDCCIKVVRSAIELGYQHIDTAGEYQNHEALGKAIKGFDRTKLYLASKINPGLMPESSIQKACEKTLKELNTDYLDLFYLHWPAPEEVFLAMQKLIDQGKIRCAGVSNYSIELLEKLRTAGGVPFAFQIEFAPNKNYKNILNYCHTHLIELVAFCSFGQGSFRGGDLLIEYPEVKLIGAKHNKSAAQVLLRWVIQKGVSVIQKASTEAHLKENIQIFDFSLTNEEMDSLEILGEKLRLSHIRPEDYPRGRPRD